MVEEREKRSVRGDRVKVEEGEKVQERIVKKKLGKEIKKKRK